MNKYIFIIGILILTSCSSVKYSSDSLETKRLNFEHCLLEEKGFNFLEITLPKGYNIKHHNHHGFCEYQFKYRDSSFFYISTEVYSGSKLNSINRKKIGINTYAVNRNLAPIDTIRNSGIQANGRFWLEHILGGYVVGYNNMSSDRVEDFMLSISSVKKL